RGEQRARRRTEEHASAVAQHLPLLRRQEQEGTDPHHPGLERDHPGKLVARMGPVNVARRQREEREARGREADAEPLALAELEAEQALGQEAEEDEPGRERRLDDRERRDPEGADVQEPPHGRGYVTDRPPLRPEQPDDGPERAPNLHHGRGGGSSLPP